MSAEIPEKPTPPANSLRRLEALPASTAGQRLDLPEVPEVPDPVRRPWLWYAVGGLVVAAVLWLVFGGPILPPTTTKQDSGENGIAQALGDLSRATDLPTCQVALARIGSQLLTDKKSLPTLAKPRQVELKKRFDLDEGALAEIETAGFTKLDAVYLEHCLLFRDAVRAIEPANVTGITDAALRTRYLERARLAFAWTVRQVRLEEERETARRIDPLVVPPAYTLRKGVGSPLERALVFLALLDQMAPTGKIEGCLVFCPEKAAGEPVLWACGVLVAGKPDLYLFDPRLGLPLPAKDGKGVATLGEIVREPAVLAALNVRPDVKYSPAGALAAQATLRSVVALSALAPRLAYLQDKVFGRVVPVRLARDPDALAQALNEAAKTAGLKSPQPQVSPWTEGTRQTPTGAIPLPGADLLRRFLPVADGGSDKGQYLQLNPDQVRRFQLIPQTGPDGLQPFPRQGVWRLSAVPFEFYPSFFADPARFPRTVGLGLRVYNAFAEPFVRAIIEARKPRDLVLRGRYTQAAPDLVAEREQMMTAARALRIAGEKGDLSQRVTDWLDQATKAYADELDATAAGNRTAQASARQRIEKLWHDADAVWTVLAGYMARPRVADLTYQIALCKHEAAEAKQVRLDLARELSLPIAASDQRSSEEAWRDARGWWKRYAENFDAAPGQGAARRLHARALACLGQRDEAVALLQNLSPPLLPLEQVADLYLAAKK